MIGRAFCNHVYRTGDRIATVERALGTAQNFDALDMAKRAERARGATSIDVVDGNADRAFRARIEGPGSDTADIKMRTSCAKAAAKIGRAAGRDRVVEYGTSAREAGALEKK